MINKGIIFFIVLMISAFLVEAQDIILKRDGKEIQCLVVDISPGVVKYRKFEQQQGPVYSIAVEQVNKIFYESGKIITFEHIDKETRAQDTVSIQKPERPSNKFGFHLGFGASNIIGDIEGSEWQVASAFGASYNLSLGVQNTLSLGFDVLGLGCELEDVSGYISDSSYVEFTNWQQDMGYIGFQAVYRQYFNRGRNYFAQAGFYGSFLLTAEWYGDITAVDTNGYVTYQSFSDDTVSYTHLTLPTTPY